MTEEQKRLYQVQQFHSNLNTRKPYFAGIQKSIVPIVEVSEVDEQSIISKVESVKESVKEVKLEVKQETLPTEKEESSEEGEESGDEDMEGSKKKKKE